MGKNSLKIESKVSVPCPVKSLLVMLSSVKIGDHNPLMGTVGSGMLVAGGVAGATNQVVFRDMIHCIDDVC